jgi:agmatinase
MCSIRPTLPARGRRRPGDDDPGRVLALLCGFAGLNLVAADIVEVAPGYDHAELTGIAAASLGYEILSLMALR